MTYNKSMAETTWTIALIGQAKKADKNLSKIAAESFVLLVSEMKSHGPYRKDWPNYTKMPNDHYHCHLKKSRRPTYVVCWQVYKVQKIIEVYYAGTHENAPY